MSKSEQKRRLHQVEIPGALADHFNIQYEPGWQNPFSRDDAPEAKWRPGDRVAKGLTESGDVTPQGTMGTVLGSIYTPGTGVAYWVEWDDKPKQAVFVVEKKLTAGGR